MERMNKKKEMKRRHREFDFSKHFMRQIALKVAYFGWNYQGFASQIHTQNTVEEQIFQALEKVKLIKGRGTDLCHFSRCGRTDKGVSAVGQVLGLQVRSNLSPQEQQQQQIFDDHENNSDKGKQKVKQELDYIKLLNRVLPDDIRVLAWASVKPHFDARFHCIYRTYKYFFVKRKLNVEMMKEAAQQFVGTHDFRNFCKINAESVKSFTRKILYIDIVKSDLFLQRHVEDGQGNDDDDDDEKTMYEIIVCGYSFLWHQVRCMAAILFMIGSGQEEPDIISNLLNVDKNPSRPQYDIASELPLLFYECGFEELEWKSENPFSIQEFLREHYFKMWEQTAIKLSLLDQMLASVEIFQGERTSASELDKVINHFATKKKHIPLLKRPTAASVEERQENLKKKKQNQ